MRNTSTILSVSDLTRTIKRTLEQDFKGIAVQGELSNCKLHTSGHFYFTLKDEASQIQGVMWRSRVANLFFTPQDGMKIVVRGNVTVYEPRGIYQIDATFLQPLGVGELQLAFERLKERLSAEGLFNPAHKKPIPPFPRTIGIVTSETGAAIRDIHSVITRRFPSVQLILASVKVQGSGAAEEIANAIKDFNLYGNIDVMIVGRGGGSLEDLWAFNEEIVARAIYDSKIPIISAVGHEIDFTIADFVADLRAPTPSAAAEMAVNDFREIVEIVRNFQYTSKESILKMIQSHRDNIGSIIQSYAFNKPLDQLRQMAQRLDEYRRGLDRTMLHRFQFLSQQRMSLHQRITALDPHAVLQRGYAIISKGEIIISSRAKLAQGDDISVQFHDGTASASVKYYASKENSK